MTILGNIIVETTAATTIERLVRSDEIDYRDPLKPVRDELNAILAQLTEEELGITHIKIQPNPDLVFDGRPPPEI